MNYNFLLSLFLLITLFGCNNGNNEPIIPTNESGYLEINDCKHYYQINGTGDTLLVLHGGPGLSHKYLKPQLDSLLAAKFTLLYYDQRGSGWSDGEKDTARLSIETYVKDLEQVRKHFGLDKVNLLGHSFGGLLAMYYSIENPTKVNSLILVDTDAASYDLRTPYQIKMIDARLTEQQNSYLDSMEQTQAFKNYDPLAYEAYYKTFLTSYFANPNDTGKLTLGFDTISVPKISNTNTLVRAKLGNYDIHDRLPTISSRTLIMQGTESVFSVEGAKAVQQKIPNSELHLFENCGHFEYIEFPEKFKKLLFDFYGIE